MIINICASTSHWERVRVGTEVEGVSEVTEFWPYFVDDNYIVSGVGVGRESKNIGHQ